MSASSPDSALQKTVCARCGSMVAEARGGSSCPACMASDLAGGEWSDLLTPGGAEMLAGGGFTLVEEIGRGGMGIVYRARQRAPERDVALKLLPPSYSSTSDGAQRLMAESAMMAEMDHPGILPLYASGVQDGRPWLAMKLACGGTLAARKTGWRGRWREAAELAAGLADAVQHAHERGLIHRDLKPGNILFDETGRAYVADFGLAKWRDVDSGLTHTNMVLGTPAYMAPEVARADVRAATTSSDVYGLGAILYFLLCGQPPFPQAGTLEILRSIVDDDPAPPRSIVPDVPGDLQVICLKALARQPSGRYSGPDALAADLRRWLAGESIEARPATRGEKFRRWVRRHPLSAGLAAALLITIAGSGVMLWQKQTALIGSLAKTKAALKAQTEALETAENSRRAAYGAFGFVMREMPSRFADRGRLGDFGDIFKNVETQLLALDTAGGPENSMDRVYLADLYIHWSRVLGWSGEPEQCKEKLKLAVSIAEEVAGSPAPVAEAWRVLSAAHRLRGKFLVEDDEDFINGGKELEMASSAVAAGLARFPGEIGLKVEEAEVATDIADSHVRDQDWDALTTAALDAQRLWNALRPALKESDVPSFFLDREREKSPYPWFLLGMAADGNSDHEAAGTFYRSYLKEREDQVNGATPVSGDRRWEYVVALNRVALNLWNREPRPIDEVKALFEKADTRSTEFIESDPQNERGREEYARVALCMADVCGAKKDMSNRIKWLNACFARLKPSDKSLRPGIHEIRLLALQRLAGASEETDGADERWEECLRISRDIVASPQAVWSHHTTYADSLKYAGEYYEKKLSAGGLEAWARKWMEDARDARIVQGGSNCWKAAEACACRRLADLLKDTERTAEAGEFGRAALTLRAELFGCGPRFARSLFKHIKSASEGLLKNPGVTEADAVMVIETLTSLVPHALACGKTGNWRKDWTKLAEDARSVMGKDKHSLIDSLKAALAGPTIAGKQPDPRTVPKPGSLTR